ncbi:MAG: hypothetical protein AMXMBFR84_31820 [Candidatus Hydrogenedentota bacterium]
MGMMHYLMDDSPNWAAQYDGAYEQKSSKTRGCDFLPFKAATESAAPRELCCENLRHVDNNNALS